MKTYVALLRGINVGGNNKIEMKKLKGLFETLGFKNVQTYINSGNVIFTTDATGLEDTIETAIHTHFGFPVRIVIREDKNIRKLCKALPITWTNDDIKRTDILFLRDQYDSKKSLDLIKTTDVDNLMYIPGAIIWNVARVNVTKSGLRTFIGSELYKHMTARNVNTVRKLNELLQV